MGNKAPIKYIVRCGTWTHRVVRNAIQAAAQEIRESPAKRNGRKRAHSRQDRSPLEARWKSRTQRTAGDCSGRHAARKAAGLLHFSHRTAAESATVNFGGDWACGC